MKKLKKGSFTIEAALLMPLILMVLMGLLYLDFFVHNRAWLTSAAYEAAVSGSMEGYKKDGDIYEKADIQGRMLGSTGLPGGENLSMQTSAGKTVQVPIRWMCRQVFCHRNGRLKFAERQLFCVRQDGYVK